MRHIDTETLLDTLEGRPSNEDAETLHRHLSECRACMDDIGTWTRMLDALTHPPLEDAPSAALEKAFDIFQSVERDPDFLSEISASVLLDSWAEPAADGLRGQAAVRQLCLSAEEYDMHVRVVYDDRGTEIRGQLLARGEGDFVGDFDVSLLDAAGQELEATVADEFGEFSFDQSHPGVRAVVASLRDGRRIQCQLPEGNPK